MLDTTNSQDVFNTTAIKDLAGVGSNIVQVAFENSATGSVLIYGRVNPNMPWVQIGDPITASALVPIIHTPFVRLVGTVTSPDGTKRIRAALAN